MNLKHQNWQEIQSCSKDFNTGQRVVEETLSMTVQECVATLAVRGDILAARRGASGSYALDKDSAYNMIKNAQTNPQYIDVIKRMQIKRETQILLDNLTKEAQNATSESTN